MSVYAALKSIHRDAAYLFYAAVVIRWNKWNIGADYGI